MFKFRYMYARKAIPGEECIDGIHYGCLMAVSMKDAKQSMSVKRIGKALSVSEFRKIKGGEICMIADHAGLKGRLGQWIRKAIYDGVRSTDDLERAVPGWSERMIEEWG